MIRYFGELLTRAVLTAVMIATGALFAHAEGPTNWNRSFARIPELEQRLRLAAENASSVIDQDLGRPFFGVALNDPRPHFYHIDHFDVPHLPGRVLDSLLMTETIAGISAEPAVIQAYQGLIYQSFAGPDELNAFQERSGTRKVVLHNLREGLLGLTALIQGRQDETAKRLASRMVRRVAGLMHPDGSWNYEAIRATPGVLIPGEIAGHDIYYTSTAGRFVGALVKYYEATKDAEALELARRIAGHALKTCFRPDGKYTEAAGWHVHSITATINSLAQLAESTGDRELMAQVERIYEKSFDGIITRFGWSKENLSNDLDTGEVNNTGDIIQTALILARNGSPGRYSDAERMLRSHVLPAQLLDVSWVKEGAPREGDRFRDVAARARGAFGFPAPYGHKIDRIDHVNFNFDITCGTAQALCEVYRSACIDTGDTITVNLLFSLEAPGLRLTSALSDRGELALETSGTRAVELRLPDGVLPENITLIVDEKPQPPQVRAPYLILPSGIRTAQVSFPLPETRTEEKLPGRTAEVYWRGEQVVRMKTSGTYLPFYDKQ